MALFSRKTESNVEKKESATAVKKTVVNNTLPTDRNLSIVLQAPRITEKSVAKGENNVYTMIVHPSATKFQVRDAVKAYFNVTPVKINIVNKKAKTTMSRAKGRTVSVKGMKKAYIYLKQGDSISIV
ncbi:50S ribosomal protein L23 [Candidatus Kaiserbacteria bacterium]|nr:50S ribosomal protein L23 [Candidatus Kaiserbacteria bacterium]